MLSVFISGLKKGCGKSLIAAGLAGTMQSLSYSVSYNKPIQTGGNLLDGDVEFIKRIDFNIKALCTHRFAGDASPIICAYEEGIKKIDIAKIFLDYKNNVPMTECHIVEGCNSISSPIDEKITEINLIEKFGLPLILVLNPNQTTMDEVIQGINYINTHHIYIRGIIINDYDSESSNLEHKYFPHLVKQYTGKKILGTFSHYANYDNLTPDVLIGDTLNNLNIEEIFGLKIAKLG